jgi:hypothetical protein
MRAILLILILAVVILIAAIATGFLDINQIRGAKAPDIDASRNGVTATGGQAPAFDIETGSVGVGTRQANVAVPTLEVKRPRDPAATAQNQAAPATGNSM